MASDFKILLHRNSDNLNLKLAGHFDATAAQKLFTFIKTHGEGACNIFIHTSNINQIHPTGPDIFRSALYGLNNYFFAKLIFTPLEMPRAETRRKLKNFNTFSHWVNPIRKFSNGMNASCEILLTGFTGKDATTIAPKNSQIL